MKIDHKAVLEVFEQMLVLADGLIETARIGDDGFINSMEDQRNDMKKIVFAFRSEHLTKEETQAITGKYDFIKDGDRIIENGQHDLRGEMNGNEITNLVKYLLYDFLKKALRENPVTPEMGEVDVRNHIDCLSYEWSKFRTYERGFSHTMFEVVCLVTDEVMEHRKQNRQLALL